MELTALTGGAAAGKANTKQGKSIATGFAALLASAKAQQAGRSAHGKADPASRLPGALRTEAVASPRLAHAAAWQPEESVSAAKTPVADESASGQGSAGHLEHGVVPSAQSVAQVAKIELHSAATEVTGRQDATLVQGVSAVDAKTESPGTLPAARGATSAPPFAFQSFVQHGTLPEHASDAAGMAHAKNERVEAVRDAVRDARATVAETGSPVPAQRMLGRMSSVTAHAKHGEREVEKLESAEKKNLRKEIAASAKDAVQSAPDVSSAQVLAEVVPPLVAASSAPAGQPVKENGANAPLVAAPLRASAPEEVLGKELPDAVSVQAHALSGRFESVLERASVTALDVPGAPFEVSVPVGQQGWSDAISKTMVNMLKDGVAQAMVSINPEHLGPLDIKISMNKGVVDVDFFSPYAEVRDALSGGSDQLQARFAEVGVRLERVESHDTLPVMKEDFHQQQEGRQERKDEQREQRREQRRENSWFAEVLNDEQNT